MDTFSKLSQTEPLPDDDVTEKITVPMASLAGMSQMARLMGPNGQEHWVKRGSMVYKLMKSQHYQEIKR